MVLSAKTVKSARPARVVGLRMPVAALLAAASLLGSVPEARADGPVRLYGGLGSWNGDHGGSLRSGAGAIDVDDDLALGSAWHDLAYAGLEHPVPGLPNLRLQYADLDIAGSATLTRNVTFNEVTFPAGAETQTSLELTQIDGTFFYRLWERGLSLDLGLTLRYLDGAGELTTIADRSRVAFEGVVPLGHLAARIELPLSGFWIGAQLDGLAFDGHRLIDATASGGWQSGFGLGVEGGWRFYHLELDELDALDASDIDIAGPYAAVNFRF